MQDSDNGYIQIPRSHPIWNLRPRPFRVAVELIRRSTHKDITFRHHGQDIELKRGQLFISERQLARDCSLARMTLSRIFECLIRVHFCVRKCVHSGFIVTICDYNYFNESKYPIASTVASTNASRVVSGLDQSGLTSRPPLYNEQGTRNNQDIKKLLTEKDFNGDEAPVLASLYPFREKRDACVQHLKNRGFIEAAIARILELIYPLEYTGRKAVNV